MKGVFKMKHVKIGKKEYTIIESDELHDFLLEQQWLFERIRNSTMDTSSYEYAIKGLEEIEKIRNEL